MAFRDIDYSLRVNGDLSVPSNSLKVGSNITLNSADGRVSATQFAGNGSLLTNLSSSAMTDVLKLDGTRAMTGALTVARLNKLTDITGDGGAGRINLYQGTTATNSLSWIELWGSSDAQRMGEVTLSGNAITVRTGSTAASTGTEVLRIVDSTMRMSGIINATVNLQEGGVNLATKYEPRGTLHDDRYYTETEMDAKLGGKSDASHNHDTVYSKLTHAHAWGEVTGKPTTFTPSGHGHAMTDITGLPAALTGKSDTSHLHDDRYYTETEMNTKLATKSDTTHAHTWAEVTGKPTTFAPSSHTHDDRYYTETEMDAKLNGKMGYGDVIMNTNPFGGKQLFINSVNNAMFRAESRWIVTGEVRKTADDTVVRTLVESSLRVLFDGNYESYITLNAGEYLYAHIDFNGGQYPGYPYGNFYLSHYHTSHSVEAKVRVYSNFQSHGIGWHEMTFADYVKNTSNYISKARNDKYAISEMEFLVYAPSTGVTSVTQIDWQLDRPGNNEMPVVDKYGPNTMYSSLSFHNINNERMAIITEQGQADFESLTVDGAPVSLNGHLHDDRYYTESEVDTKLGTKSDSGHTHTFASLTSRPTTLSGYGITDAAAGSHTHAFSAITSKPTTLSGYGITDAATSTHHHDAVYSKLTHNHDTAYAPLTHSHSQYSLTSHKHEWDYTKRGNYSESVLAIDKRTWTPTEASTSAREMVFTFTALNNDNAGPYADGILMSTYADSSAGGNNMLLAAKNGSGLYLRYGGWDATDWAWTKKLAFDEDKADKSTSITAGTGLSGGGTLAGNRTLSVSFGTSAGTVAEGNHGHAISGITGLQSALDGKSATSHTHTFASLTSRPTTLSGYGITDAATSSHHHDSQYLKLTGGNLTGGLSINSGNGIRGGGTSSTSLVLHSAVGGNIHLRADGDSATGELIITSGTISYNTHLMWHAGNFTPSQKADASTVSTHINDGSIHKDWGHWHTGGGGNDFMVSSKRAMVYIPSTNQLRLNYGNDLVGGVEVTGTLTNGGNQVWHAGNLDPSTYVGSGTGQSVGSGFSIKGRLLVGNVSGTTGDAIVYDAAGGATIHLDGNSSGIESSSATKIHLKGNGDGVFKETVTAKHVVATTSATIPTLTATTINDVHKDHYTKNDAIADNTGWGVITGLDGIAYGGELHVDPGVAYTKSGRRVEVKLRQKVNMIGAPVGGNRYDVLYIKGPGSSTEEGNLHCLEGVVGQTAAQSLANPLLSDGVILATIKREIAQASITQSDIDNAVRDSGTIAGRKPLYVEDATKNVKARYELHAAKFKEGGSYLNALYATLAGGNTFTSNQKFNGRVHISATGTMGLVATSGNYALRVGSDTSYIAMDSNEILATSDLHVNAATTLNLSGSIVNLNGKVSAPSNAKTVTIPAGQTSVTWTHGHGSTSYAVNLTSNSFERHVRWTSKTSNSVTIELDDASTQETLVDCILIGY